MEESKDEEKVTTFEDKVLHKLTEVNNRLAAFECQLAKLERMTHSLGIACSHAFSQVKVVIEHLTEAVDDTRQDLSEYGGVITKSTWDTDPFC